MLNRKSTRIFNPAPYRLLLHIHRLEIIGHLIMLYSSHMYILYFSLSHSNIALLNLYIFLNSILLLLGCVYCSEWLDITALLELETQAFRDTRNNICLTCVCDK